MSFEDTSPVTLPNGVILRAPEDFSTLRKSVFEQAKSNLTAAFPVSYNGMRMELHDADYADPEEYSLAEQRKALMHDKFLGRRLRGKLKLFDEATGAQMDERELTLMRVPYLTERGTFIHGGNEYAHVHQARLLHGPYTRRQNNGELETQFNVKQGTGVALRVRFEPSSAQYRLKVGGSNLHLYSLLRDIGTRDEDLAATWGEDILESNRAKYDARVLDKAYKNIVARRNQLPDADPTQKAKQIREALEAARLHAAVVRRTLPNALNVKSATAWRMSIAVKMAAQDAIEFQPTLELRDAAMAGVEAFYPDLFWTGIKSAAGDGFTPDLDADQMREAYDALYAKIGPRLASMNQWPSDWFTPDSDPLGWVSWYMKYTDGHRGPDDERQIRRWKAFKARHGAQFQKKPTARRAFALRYWAIDPLKLLKSDEDRERLKAEMKAHREEAWKAHAPEPEASSFPIDTTTPIPTNVKQAALLQNDDWVQGFLNSITKSCSA